MQHELVPVRSILTHIKELGRERHHIESCCAELKRKLGITPQLLRNGLPNVITYNPEYDKYLEMVNKIRELTSEIRTLRHSLPDYPVDNFESIFVAMMKQRHFDIYEQIKQEIKTKQQNKC